MNYYEKIIKEMTIEDMAFYMKKLTDVSCKFCPAYRTEDECMKFNCSKKESFIDFLKSEVNE